MWKFLEPVLDSPQIVWATYEMIYALNCVLVYEAGNGHGIRFHKVESMFDEWAAHG